MIAIWDKNKPRIQFIVSDGNRAGVHFLITPREKVGWNYFRLGSDPKLQVLDESESPFHKLPPTEVAYWLARELRDKKEIVQPPKKP